MNGTTYGRSVQGYGVTHTLEETARLLGVTRERVRQIEEKALRKLRFRLHRYGITDIKTLLGGRFSIVA